MSIIFGSARIDENGNITGGAAGDQTGNEVSTQGYYMHSQGWYCLRPKSVDIANKIAQAMQQACNNNNIGYDQNQRNTVITQLKAYGSLGAIKTKCEADCSSLVRACILQASGKDVGDFTTGSEASILEVSGLFEKRFSVSSESQLYNGDVLVTKTKGHTVIVVSGRARSGGATTSWKATGTATCTDSGVRVRSTPSDANLDNVIGKLGVGNRFEVDGKVDGDWIHVKVAGIGIGWAHKDYVKYDSAPSQNVKVDSARSFAESKAGTYQVVNTGGEGLSLRSGAGTNKAQIDMIPDGGKVRNYGYYTNAGGYNWLYVTYNGKTGFVCDGGYLKKL